MGDLSKRTREAYLFLCAKQQEMMENPTAVAIQKQTIANTRWQRLAELEEEVLKQKSKMHWLEVDDGNNRFFHSSRRIKEVRNAIHEIKSADGSLTKTDDKIKEEAQRFFKEFMEYQPQEYIGVSVDRLKEILKSFWGISVVRWIVLSLSKRFQKRR